jgi:hypothetical protein
MAARIAARAEEYRGQRDIATNERSKQDTRRFLQIFITQSEQGFLLLFLFFSLFSFL